MISFWSELMMVTTIGILAVTSPGPDFVIVTRNSLLYSKQVGVCTALGIALGTVWWVVASLLGISYLISQAVILFSILKWVGALYLVYIGVQALMSKQEKDEDEIGEIRLDLTPLKAFQTGLLVNLFNPKAAIFFVSFFSVILTPETPYIWKMFYGLEISLIALVWFSLVALFLSMGRIKELFRQCKVWIDRVMGAILIGLGIKLALSEAR